MIEFAKTWDPRTIHVDDDAVKSADGRDGVTALVVFDVAKDARLPHRCPITNRSAVIAWGGRDGDAISGARSPR